MLFSWTSHFLSCSLSLPNLCWLLNGGSAGGQLGQLAGQLHFAEFPPKDLPNSSLWLSSGGRFAAGWVWGQKASSGSCNECQEYVIKLSKCQGWHWAGTFASASKGLPFCYDKTYVQHLGPRPWKVGISDGLTLTLSTYKELASFTHMAPHIYHRLESWLGLW